MWKFSSVNRFHSVDHTFVIALFEFSMRRMQRDEHLRASCVLQVGRRQREHANTSNVSKSVSSRLWNRYQQIYTLDDRHRSGRPRATAGVQGRFIYNQAIRNRSQTANENVANLLQATGVRVIGQTIRNRFHADHLHARRPRVEPTLTNRRIALRACRER